MLKLKDHNDENNNLKRFLRKTNHNHLNKIYLKNSVLDEALLRCHTTSSPPTSVIPLKRTVKIDPNPRKI